MAIILVTHKLQTAKIANRIYVIENGMIVANDTPDTLSKEDNYYSQLIEDNKID